MPNPFTHWFRSPAPEAKASRALQADHVDLCRDARSGRRATMRRCPEGARRTPSCIGPCGSWPRRPLPFHSGLSTGKGLSEHPLLTLLARPNPREGGQRFLESVYGHLMVSGNAYVEAVRCRRQPAGEHALRPDRMRVIPGSDGWPAAYEYSVGASTIQFVQGEGVPSILHLSLFHPADDHYVRAAYQMRCPPGGRWWR